MYKDIAQYVETCVVCQMYSNVRHRDGLQPTYPPAMHYKWVVDLVTMPLGIWQMQYVALAREDLINQVEVCALRTKSTKSICKFLLEDVICRYGCVGKITADRGELDAEEAREFFSRIGIKLALTCAYNPEGNGKSERGHPPQSLKLWLRHAKEKWESGQGYYHMLYGLTVQPIAQWDRIYACRINVWPEASNAG